ncbi:MAG: LPS export ABC transporter permease LptG [Smithellaceae bacterium]
MKIIDRYILKEFSKLFIIISITFIALYLIGDSFERIRMFLSNNASVAQMASYFFYSIPMIISLVLPFAVLLATLMAYGSLSKHNEITALKANGISLYRISLPALIFAAVLAVFLFYFNELITPASIQKTENIIKIEIQKQQALGFFKQNEIWYRSGNAIYNFKMFDVNKNTLRGVTINYLNPDFTLNMRIDAQSAEWNDDHWIFHNLLITTFDSNNIPVLERAEEKIINIPERPDNFKIIQKDAEKMGYFELRKYVKKIQAEGYDITRYLVDLQGKIAFPLVTIILVFIGVFFSLRSERSGGVMQSVGMGILIGASYWIIHAFSLSLGRSGTLSPIIAAWAANILFISIALALFHKART